MKMIQLHGKHKKISVEITQIVLGKNGQLVAQCAKVAVVGIAACGKQSLLRTPRALGAARVGVGAKRVGVV